MPLPVSIILALSAACAPAVSPQTMAAVVQAESSGDPFAIGINGRRPVRIHARDQAEAVRTASRLLAEGANLDLGLGQINHRNLASLGLSIADAFDPCRNLAGSAQIIASDYARAAPEPGAEQAALRTSLSLYNTGDRTRGFRNGYVAKVLAAAKGIVPALDPMAVLISRPTAASTPAPPPAWDVFAQAPAPIAGFLFQPTGEPR